MIQPLTDGNYAAYSVNAAANIDSVNNAICTPTGTQNPIVPTPVVVPITTDGSTDTTDDTTDGTDSTTTSDNSVVVSGQEVIHTDADGNQTTLILFNPNDQAAHITLVDSENLTTTEYN